MADIPYRLKFAVDTQVNFSAAQYTGLGGINTTALGKSWCWYDGVAWGYSPRADVDGNTTVNSLVIDGDTVITSGRAAAFTACTVGGLAVVTSVAVTREAIIQPLPITNSAPGVVNVVDANMKSFGFDGGASTEELFYHCDVQHDYIAGGDMVFHVHWMPATAAGGDVKWQVHYQWVEAGATWPAASPLSSTVAAGSVAWADKHADITLPGAGHTYNSRIMIRLFRNPVDAADTYGGDAVLSSVGMHYSASPSQP